MQHYSPPRSPGDRMADDAITGILTGIGYLLVMLVVGAGAGVAGLVRLLIPKDTSLKLPLPARFEHTHIVAGSGHGKTQLLQHMFATVDVQAVAEGQRSIIVIDSQGDLIRNILSLQEFSPSHPNSLSDRLVLIDPTDIASPPCLNLFDFGLSRLHGYNPLEREKLVNGAIALYEYLFSALLGAELTNRQGVIFRYLARLLMVVPGATIYTLMDFMEEPRLIRPYLSKVDGPTARFS